MRNWLEGHRLRRQRSDVGLPAQGQHTAEVATYNAPLPASSAYVARASEFAASKTTSRMSIERYLQAPLEDEPATVPAISAALKEQTSPTRSNQYRTAHLRGHSRETSYDANSEGRHTFYTSASGHESTGTSFSAGLRSNHDQRSNTHSRMPQLPKLDTVALEHVNVQSPEESITARTMDSERTLTEAPETSPSGTARDRAYRVKIEAELAHIQQKARELEERMRRFDEERENSELLVPRINDHMIHEQIASKPKLAWILGEESKEATSIRRSPSSASVGRNVSNDIPSRPSTGNRQAEELRHRLPRRSQSSSALHENSKHSTVTGREIGGLGRTFSRRPKFFCTFCQKRFHSKAEWMSHEKEIHMPEGIWVCCPRIGEPPERCPFCAETHPSASHLQAHNYLNCYNKPLPERTFHKKDSFLQHISQEHNVSAGQKPLRLTELLEAWRHPLPLEQGHPALHCGFCGLTFPTYRERTEHVCGHFVKGVDMMSWWSGRVNHEITPRGKPAHDDPNSPHRCCYCSRTYRTLGAALESHPVCTMWSCSFLPGLQYTIYPSGSRHDLETVCCYCNNSLTTGSGKVKGAVLREHVGSHNFRNCNQRLYFSAQRFRQHLQDSHRTNYDGTLFAGWTLLLKSSKQEKTATFEAVDSVGLRRAYTDPDAKTGKSQKQQARTTLEPRMNFMDLSETPETSSGPKMRIHRKTSAQTMPEAPTREVRDSTTVFFTRAATINLAYGDTAPPSSHVKASSYENDQQHKPVYPVASRPTDAVSPSLKFYRRRIDASTRNRMYIRDEDEGPLTRNSERLFRKIPGSAFGGLVLHSSLLAATPARLTNSVDIFSIH